VFFFNLCFCGVSFYTLYKILLPELFRKTAPVCLLVNSCLSSVQDWVQDSLHHLHNTQCHSLVVSQLIWTRYLITTHLNVLYVHQTSILEQSRVFTESAKRSFSYFAPKIWNNIRSRVLSGLPLDLTSDFPMPSQPVNAILNRTYLNSFHISVPPSSGAAGKRRGGGQREGIRPGRHCAGAAFGGAKIWNTE